MAEKPSAAKEALSKVEDRLQCPVCLEPYTNPRLLACFHVYCQHCLQAMADRSQQRGRVTCPKCRRDTALPPTGPAGLQAAFHVHHLFDIQDTLKKIKEPQKLACEKCTKTTRQATSFCRQCAAFVCEMCTTMHKEWDMFEGHEVVSIEMVEGDLIRLVSPKKVVRRCGKHSEDLKIYCETCGELICRDCIIQLHKDHKYCVIADSFESHKKEILDSLTPIEKQLEATNTALLKLDERCDSIVRRKAVVEAEINSAIDEAHRALDARREELLAQLEMQTQQKLKNMSAQRESVEIFQTQRNGCLHFVEESIRTGSPGDVLKMKAGVVKQVEELVESFDPNTLKPCELANSRFTHSGQLIRQCQEIGKIDQLRNFQGTFVKSIDDVKGPEGIAINKSGEVIVAEHGADCVSIFSPAGDKIRTITGQGTAAGGMDDPYGIAVDRDDNILVVDSSNYRLLKFSPKGELIGTVGSRGDGPGQFKDALGICVNSVNGKVYVSDNSADCVHVFNSDLTFSSKFGSEGHGDGELFCPWYIAADSSGCVYVADSDNHRVQVFTADGRYLRQFGKEGSGNGELASPRGICVDNDLVYISEVDNNRVSVFTSEGEFVKCFGSEGEGPGQFSSPRGVAVDSSGVVYVCDNDNDRVQLFN